jgi:hypothetical protein
MSKKIKIKINEQQYLNIVNRLSENVGLDDTFFNIKPNESIVLKDDSDVEFKIKFIKNINDDYFFKDANNLDVKISKDGFNKLNNELTINTVNPTTKMYIPKTIKVKSFEKFEGAEDDENDGETSNDDALFSRYYQDIMNDPNVKKAFYTAPNLWNYIVAAAKGEKAKGTGIYPAYQLINKYYNSMSDEKLPGFTDKENSYAFFLVPNRIEISYYYLDKTRDVFILDAGKNKAVVRPYEPGYSNNKVLVRRTYGFKIIVKKPTGDKQDQYYCDIYVEKKNVEKDTYKIENVKLTFLKSNGYEPQIPKTN